MYPMIISGVVVTCIVLVIYKLLSRHLQQKQKIKQGILLTSHLKLIIDRCQKHRGTTNAYMQGNAKLLPQLTDLQADIDSLINNDVSSSLAEFPQWSSFAEHWPKLKKHALDNDLPAQNIVRQHSLMIDGQLMLLDDVMRAYDIHRLMLDSYTHVSEICLDTLRAAETLGYTRTIGSGVCARGLCLAADKVLLEFLRISVRTSSERLLSEINRIKNKDLTSLLATSSVAIQQQVDALLNMVDKRVLQHGQLKLDSHEYFTLSTRAIDEVLKIFSIVIQYASRQQTRII
ncbi:nitrate- and nitrite sensing domain-containing protein [Methylophaga sulfidovorans]|uniref:Nitrate and nitrite sensing n=1 Tax=Methylophaga sulfidovorans TaxID=45496 RepID=A0A1I4BI57_9GAMM|nr:nitrate- and nitrite sensing domain-containing protein [Methylophaga sulfidovorans]SFK68535.1 Nitrate and nitrite sensing [Methylophaga sulfidovorans]